MYTDAHKYHHTFNSALLLPLLLQCTNEWLIWLVVGGLSYQLNPRGGQCASSRNVIDEYCLNVSGRTRNCYVKQCFPSDIITTIIRGCSYSVIKLIDIRFFMFVFAVL